MKKLLLVVLSLMTMMVFTACGNEKTSTSQEDKANSEDKTRQNARTGLRGLDPALCPERKILGRRPAADAALGREAFGPAGRAAKAPRRPIHRRQPLRRSLRARQNPAERLGRPQDPHLAPAQRHRRSDHR